MRQYGPNCFGFRKIAMMASYIAPAMIGLILTLALAIRSVACALGPSRRLQKGRVTAVSKRFALGPSRFPAISLLA